MRSGKATVAGFAAVAAAGIAILSSGAGAKAWPRYNDGCQNCHGEFTDWTSPKGTTFPGNDKHQMHRSSSSMGTACALCHTSGDDRNPFLGSSDGNANTPGLGCTGCHGRDYGGNIGSSAVGLRAHHFANGVSTCAGCHTTDPTPLPESVEPVYYSSPDTNVGDPCNTSPDFLENWSIGDTEGLDNDGDNDYDEADSDCASCAPDYNGDGNVNSQDFIMFLNLFVSMDPLADYNGDGNVNSQDFIAFLNDFVAGC